MTKVISTEGTSKAIQFLEKKIDHNTFLEDQFKRLFSSYVLAFNKQEERTGSLFQKRFKRVSIKNEAKLWHILVYIHHNPIHHKFESNYSSWKYSSFNSFLSKKPTLLSRDLVLSWLDKNIDVNRREFMELHENFKLDTAENYLE